MAEQISTQSKETLSLITNSLMNHLNVGQNQIVNSSSVFLSVETTSIGSLPNKIIQQAGDAQIRIPSSFTLTSDGSTSISLRVRFFIIYF
jgi:hypothetical protein